MDKIFYDFFKYISVIILVLLGITEFLSELMDFLKIKTPIDINEHDILIKMIVGYLISEKLFKVFRNEIKKNE
jgi:hypothetical protein